MIKVSVAKTLSLFNYSTQQSKLLFASLHRGCIVVMGGPIPRRHLTWIVILVGLTSLPFGNPGASAQDLRESGPSDCEEQKLARGEILTTLEENPSDAIKYVVARIIVNEPPEKVWPVLVNPYEFEGKICPRMHNVEVLEDSLEHSLLRCSIEVGWPIPKVSYTVDSTYDTNTEIKFHRVAGDLRDFRGTWVIKPRDNGKSSEIVYSMFIDPGLPVPRWMVREAVRIELPHTLANLRKRVEQVDTAKGLSEPRSIMAGTGVNNAKLSQIMTSY